MHTRPAAVAGTFYPENPDALSAQIEKLLNDNPVASLPAAPPRALVVPHAGYIYSGPTAAVAYNTLLEFKGNYERVVLLGLSHRLPFRGIALPSVEQFATPLGDIDIDRQAIESLQKLESVVELDDAHCWEHSLEVQLPFLQRVLGTFRLVPLATGQCSPQDVAECLELFWPDERTLILVSSDLSHFHNYQDACSIDRQTCQLVLQKYAQLTGEQACGSSGLNGLLHFLADKNIRLELLDYRNSGDTAGDMQRVVGYGAFVVYMQ